MKQKCKLMSMAISEGGQRETVIGALGEHSHLYLGLTLMLCVNDVCLD